MKIIYKTGDLLSAPEPIICHGCNAQGRMKSGVAKVLRAKYPQAYEAYMREFNANGLRVGQVIWAVCDPHLVANAITQHRYGYDADKGEVYVSYEGLRQAIIGINQGLSMTPGYHVAFPLIGAGLAGGSWKIISQIIEEESTNFQPVVYTLDGIIPET